MDGSMSPKDIVRTRKKYKLSPLQLGELCRASISRNHKERATPSWVCRAVSTWESGTHAMPAAVQELLEAKLLLLDLGVSLEDLRTNRLSFVINKLLSHNQETS